MCVSVCVRGRERAHCSRLVVVVVIVSLLLFIHRMCIFFRVSHFAYNRRRVLYHTLHFFVVVFRIRIRLCARNPLPPSLYVSVECNLVHLQFSAILIRLILVCACVCACLLMCEYVFRSETGRNSQRTFITMIKSISTPN